MTLPQISAKTFVTAAAINFGLSGGLCIAGFMLVFAAGLIAV